MTTCCADDEGFNDVEMLLWLRF